MSDQLNDIQQAFDQVAKEVPKDIGPQVFYTFEELWGVKDDQVEFLINELIPKNSVAVLVGEDGIGKTQICVQLCLHIGLKMKTFLNFPLNVQHNKTLLVATETSKNKFIRAAARQAKELCPNLNPKDVGMDFMEGYAVETYDELCDKIEARLKTISYDLIVIDAMSDLFVMVDGNINDASDARRIIARLQKICEENSITIILIHHVAKTKMVGKREKGRIFAEKDDQQGSGAITQKPRTVLGLSTDPKTIISTGNIQTYDNFLHVLKANEMGRQFMVEAIRCSFDSSTLIHTYKGLQNISEYEAGNSGEDSKPEKNKTKAVYDYEIHRANILQAFALETKLTSKTLTIRLKSVYNVGANKIEESGGIREQLISAGLINKFGKEHYVLAIIPDEIDKDNQQQKKLPGMDEDAPF